MLNVSRGLPPLRDWGSDEDPGVALYRFRYVVSLLGGGTDKRRRGLIFCHTGLRVCRAGA